MRKLLQGEWKYLGIFRIRRELADMRTQKLAVGHGNCPPHYAIHPGVDPRSMPCAGSRLDAQGCVRDGLIGLAAEEQEGQAQQSRAQQQQGGRLRGDG